jgi:ribosomal protein S18 acetylase RimI-like enzyme
MSYSRGVVIQGAFPTGVPNRSAQRGNQASKRNPATAHPLTYQELTIQAHLRSSGHSVQAVGSDGRAFVVPSHLASLNRSGQKLPIVVRQKMESFFGADFSDVQVHIGPEASAIGALAFTQGANIHFAPGQYNPNSHFGQQLLGHELTHVMQQRAGRVRNPFGSGIAVVQDPALEAEAEHMGTQAAMHVPSQVPIQAKMSTGVQRATAEHVSGPIKVRDGEHRITIAHDGKPAGSVMVHSRDRTTIEVTDLGVDPVHRGNGLGQKLLHSALRTGLQFGRKKVTLGVDDNGSGRLTKWYKQMGFRQSGIDRQGHPRMEAPIHRVLSGVAQGKMDPALEAEAERMGTQTTPLRRTAGAAAARRPNSQPAFWARTLLPSSDPELMEESDEDDVVDGNKAAKMIVKYIYGKLGTNDNWTVGVLSNGDLIIGKVNGVTSATKFTTDLGTFIKGKGLEKGRDIYLAKVFCNGSSRHAEMCVLAAADKLEETVSYMICVAPNCDFCAQMLTDANVTSDKFQGNDPTSQQGWTHPRKKVAYGTQLAASLKEQLKELEQLNSGKLAEKDITKGQIQGVAPVGQYEKWL